MKYLLDSNIWIKLLQARDLCLVVLQIAAVAQVHKLIVVTGNVGEFNRVHGLKVENWLATDG